MATRLTRTGRYAVAAASVLLSADVLAGGSSAGTITYAPQLASVPVLGGTGLLALSALLGLVALRFLKEKKRGSHFLVLAIATAALATAGSGIKLISDAQAVEYSVVLTNAGGGTVNIPFPGFNSVFNNSGGTQNVIKITPAAGCSVQPTLIAGNGGIPLNGGGFVGTCSDSPPTQLPDQAVCEVNICCGGPNGGGCLNPD